MTILGASNLQITRKEEVPFTLQTFVCLALVMLVGTDVFALIMGEGVGAPKMLCYLAIFGLCALYGGTYLRGALASPPLLALVGLACLSIFWSIRPFETVERLIALVACTSLGILFGRGHSLRGLILFLALLGTVTAWISLLAIAGFPEARGTPPWDTTWRGIFNHKNGLGAAMAVSLPFTLYGAIVARGTLRKVFVSGALACLLLLFASESRTAQIIAVIATANLLVGVSLTSRRLSWAIITLLLLAFAAGLVLFLFATGITDSIFSALGRKPTMSGRIPLWGLIWPYVLEKPLLGYGYSAFWDPESDRVFLMSINPGLRFAPFYSHNGLLETLLAVGAVGASFLTWMILSAFRCVIQILKHIGRTEDVVPLLVFLVSFCLMNVTESSVLQRDALIWVVFVAVLVRLSSLLTSIELHSEQTRNAELGRRIEEFSEQRTEVSV